MRDISTIKYNFVHSVTPYYLRERLVGDLKKDTDVVIEEIKKRISNGSSKDSIRTFINKLPEEITINNEPFWNAMRELGISNVYGVPIGYRGVDKSSTLYWKEEAKARKEHIIKAINNNSITIDEFKKRTNSVDRDDPKFMMDVLSANEQFYCCLSARLKKDETFMSELLKKNPRIAKAIEEEQSEEKVKKQLEEQKKKNANKEKRVKKDEELNKKEDQRRQEYEQLGDNHPRLILVNNFLESNKSRRLFCQDNGINEKELDEALKEVTDIYPEIKQKVEDKNRQASAIYLNTVENINKKLLSGEMTLIQYSRENNANKKIDELLKVVKNVEDRRNLQVIIINAIASGNLKMMDYVRLFSTQHDYKTVINSINAFIKIVGKEIPELQGRGKTINLAQIQIRELKKFEKQYKASDFIGSSRGHKDDNGEINMITITDEHIAYAKKYLKLEDEYICYKTMNETISKLIKGEITREEIDQMVDKRNKFLALKQKEQEVQKLRQEEEQTNKEMITAEALKEEYEERIIHKKDKDSILELYNSEGFYQNVNGEYFNPWIDEYDENYNPHNDNTYENNEER